MEIAKKCTIFPRLETSAASNRKKNDGDARLTIELCELTSDRSGGSEHLNQRLPDERSGQFQSRI
jgi:hypothetical protein